MCTTNINNIPVYHNPLFLLCSLHVLTITLGVFIFINIDHCSFRNTIVKCLEIMKPHLCHCSISDTFTSIKSLHSEKQLFICCLIICQRPFEKHATTQPRLGGMALGKSSALLRFLLNWKIIWGSHFVWLGKSQRGGQVYNVTQWMNPSKSTSQYPSKGSKCANTMKTMVSLLCTHLSKSCTLCSQKHMKHILLTIASTYFTYIFLSRK